MAEKAMVNYKLFFDRNGVNFDLDVLRKRLYFHGGPCRFVIPKESRVGLVHGLEVLQIGHEHSAANDVFLFHSRFFNDGQNVFQTLFGLIFDVFGNQ